MTTVDPETCERDAEGEPLKSLKKWRQAAGRDREFLDMYKTTPMVGMNTVLIKPKIFSKTSFLKHFSQKSFNKRLFSYFV